MNYGSRFLTSKRRQGIKTIPNKKKCKKAKWLSDEALLRKEKKLKAKEKRKDIPI